MGDTMLNQLVDELMNDEINVKKMVSREEDQVISVEQINEVEAMPYFDDEEIIGMPSSQTLKDDYSSLSKEIKRIIDEYLKENSSLYALKYEIDNNKILIQDLKNSVVSLKVSTSRIEKEVKELSNNIGSISKEKKQLDNSLIDLEFRFNELVTHQEECDMNNNSNNDSNPPDDALVQPVSNLQPQAAVAQYDEELQNSIKDVVGDLESKIKELDQRIINIDDQNKRIVNLGADIAKHEKHVKDIKQTLNFHAEDLTKLDNLTKKVVLKTNTPQIRKEDPSNDNTLVMKMNEFIAKTEHNEKSIATAWVGLIAALLLIPIAFIMGKML